MSPWTGIAVRRKERYFGSMDKVPAIASLISVVIPLYNEGSHLRQLLSDLRKALQQTGCHFEIVVIDDGSTDDTWGARR